MVYADPIFGTHGLKIERLQKPDIDRRLAHPPRDHL